jgi:hypothetical protein
VKSRPGGSGEAMLARNLNAAGRRPGAGAGSRARRRQRRDCRAVGAAICMGAGQRGRGRQRGYSGGLSLPRGATGYRAAQVTAFLC